MDGLGLRIINLFDIHNADANTEYGMQFLSGVNSGNNFYTDLNGFQVSTDWFFFCFFNKYLLFNERERERYITDPNLRNLFPVYLCF